MKINLRTDKQNPEHQHMTMFVNGQNCGRLVLSPDDADELIHVLAKGSQHNQNVTFESTKMQNVDD